MNKHKLTWILVLVFLFVGAVPMVFAQNSTIQWRGQGSDSIDCTKYGPEGGMHWVLTGARGVNNATLYLNGTAYPDTHRAGGTIHFDTPYYELDGLVAYVAYTGSLARNAQFVLSDYCPGYVPLEATKDAMGSYDRTVEWDLEKFVEPASHMGYAGQLAGTSLWTVKATKTETLDNYKVEGTITIINPNTIPVPFTVTDMLNDGTVANVTCPEYTVPANGSMICTYQAFPNDATATLNTATVESYVGGDVATAAVTFSENLIGYDEGTLRDPRVGYEEVINTTTMLEIPENFYCSADAADYENGMYSYTEINWAYLNGNLNLEDFAQVTVTCYLPALQVQKTAAGAWDRTVTWNLEKSVAPGSFSGSPGDSFDSIWNVVATKTDSGPMNYRVTGNVTINNPAAIPQTFTINDMLDDGTVAAVTCPTYTVAAGGVVVCTYEAFPVNNAATKNTATVTAVGNMPQVAEANIHWAENLTGFDEGTLSDPRFGYMAVINTSTSVDFPETFTCPPVASGLYVNGYYSFIAENWVYLNGNINLSDSAMVTVECRLLNFQSETAWAANGDEPLQLPYNPGGTGSWATYVEYEAGKCTTLFAGQHIPVGQVCFSAVDAFGNITITITLTGDWMFEDVAENVKIQDYEFAPSGNPQIGQFNWKGTASGQWFSIQVPANNFYGVHANVGYWH